MQMLLQGLCELEAGLELEDCCVRDSIFPQCTQENEGAVVKPWGQWCACCSTDKTPLAI